MEKALQALANQNFISAIVLTISMIAIGFFFTKKGWFGEGAAKVLTTLCMKLTLPCLALVGFISDFDFEQFGVFIFTFIVYVVILLLGRIFFLPYPKEDRGIYRVIFAIGQVTLFGLPVASAIYGDSVLSSANMAIFSFRLFLYIYAYFVISSAKIDAKSIGNTLKNTFLNPIMFCMIIGLIVWGTQPLLPKIEIDGKMVSIFRIDYTLPWLYTVINTIGKLSIPLGMLLVGCTLATTELKSAFSNATSYIVSAMKSFLSPLIAILLCLLWQFVFKETNAFHFTKATIATICICFASPVSVTMNAYCVSFNRGKLITSDAILMSTIMSILAIPLTIFMVELLF